MNYKKWKWTINNEKMKKTDRKMRLREIEERIRDNQFDNLKKINNAEINNKEICSKRLMERCHVKQRTFNPYLCNNNYLSDLNIQESFLKPKNSNYESLEQ